MTLQDVETARLVYYSKIKKEIITAAIIILVMLLLFVLIGNIIPETFIGIFSMFFFITAFSIVIATITNNKAYIAYRHAYKGYFVEQNLRAIFTDLEYSHLAGLPSTTLSNTGMINTGDRYRSNDFTKGKYKNVAFSQADVHIETEHTDSDGDKTYTTIFMGRFMIFEFPKQFTFRLGLIGKRFVAYYRPSTNKANGRKMEKISTESEEFNKAFRIFGEDGFEAFYLLDPAFMVKPLNIAERYKNRVAFCFYDNQLVIGINDGKDSFEPPRASKPIDEAAENAKVASDIKIITDLIDQLSLSRKLFK